MAERTRPIRIEFCVSRSGGSSKTRWRSSAPGTWVHISARWRLTVTSSRWITPSRRNWPQPSAGLPAISTRFAAASTAPGNRPIWPPTESTTPTITPQFASGWTRTANRSPEKITTIQRPMRKENACECKSNHGCNR